jgi:hypothetical protein
MWKRAMQDWKWGSGWVVALSAVLWAWALAVMLSGCGGGAEETKRSNTNALGEVRTAQPIVCTANCTE